MRLKELRLERGLTQEQVAEAIGISRSAYSHYENELRRLPVELLIQIASFYNVSTDYILNLSIKRA